MAQKFDAYYKWFGIRPDEQPPNYYRLLGIQAFEQDPDVISNAADQRMSHLRTLQNGPYAYESQRILNEVSRARVTLLDVEQKLDYDVVLRKKVAATAKADAARQDSPALGIGDDLLDELPDASNLDFDAISPQAAAAGSFAARPQGGYSVYRRKNSSALLKLVSLLIGVGLGASLVYVLLAKFAHIDPLALFPVEVAENGDDVGGASAAKNATAETTNANENESDSNGVGEADPSAEPPRVRPRVDPRNGNGGTSTSNPKPPADKSSALPPVDANANPFDEFPQFVALAAVSEKSPQALAQFGGSPAAPKHVSLVSEAAALEKGKKIELVAIPSSNMPRWTIDLVDADSGADAKREDLADLWIDGPTLFFAWDATPQRAADAAQVQNCLITLRCGKHEAALRLRAAVTLPIPVLDLSTAANLVEIPVDAPPKGESLILELGPPDTLTWNAEFQEHRNFVRFATPTRDKIVVTLDALTEQDRPQLVIEPQATPKGLSFRTAMRIVNRGEETPVSLAHVAETRKKYSALKIKTDKEWSALGDRAATLEATAKELGRQLRFSPAQRVRVERELARVNAQVIQTKAALKKVETNKDAYDGILDFLPAVEQLIDDLHTKAKIPYRVYAKAGNAEIEIARSAEPTPEMGN
jgi:hypothetical protein